MRIRAAEYRDRQRRLLEATSGVSGVLLFSPNAIFYLCGFAFISTERPIALVLGRETSVLFVPRLEVEHAQAEAAVDRVVSYPEYPSERHPMRYLCDLLRELGLGEGRIGADAPGYPPVMGYRGPSLPELLPSLQFEPVRDLVEQRMTVKSPEEVRLIRESARWAGYAHRLLQAYTRPGVVETEPAVRASEEATREMLQRLGPDYRPLSWTLFGAWADYRGQVGPQSALPHAVTTFARIRPGDVLVSGATALVYGYRSELERTMIVAPVERAKRRYFELMRGAQEVALETIRPGRTCAEVDRAIRAYFERYDLIPFWRHHVGHGIGIGIHEAPFLDEGDPTVLKPGMVLTVEPGIYVPGLGGFRHSDTVLVTESGIELLTDYPRDLPSLTIGG